MGFCPHLLPTKAARPRGPGSPSGPLHSGGAAARSATYMPRSTEAHNRPKDDRARGSRVEPCWSAAGSRRAPGRECHSVPPSLPPPAFARGRSSGNSGLPGGETGRGKGKGAGEELVREPEFLNGLTWPPVENPCGVGRLQSCAWCTHKTKRPSWKKKIISLAMPGAACQARSSATGSSGCRVKSNFARSLATTVSPSSHASSDPRPGAGSPRTRRSGSSTHSSA